MKYPGSCFWIVLILFIFSSCQKEPEINEPEVPEDGELFIKRVTLIDTTRAPGLDTISTHLFEYETDKRLRRITSFYFTLPPDAFSVAAKSTARLFYSATNPFAEKVITENLDFINPGNDYSDIIHIFYQNGKVTKDSVLRGADDTIVNNYSGLSSTRFRIITKRSNTSSSLIDTSYTYTRWENNNLVQEIDSVYFHASSPLPFINESTFTFDSNKNPFRNIFLPYVCPASVEKAYGEPMELTLFNHPNQNNILSFNSDALGNTTVEYWYNAAGLPREAKVNEGGQVYKVHYAYQEL